VAGVAVTLVDVGGNGSCEMSHMKFGGFVVRDPRDIPAAWVRLSTLNNRDDGKDTDDYKAVYRACCTGEIPTDKCCKFKLTDRDSRGPIYADPDAVAGVLQRLKDGQERRATIRQSAPQMSVQAALADLRERMEHMQATINRLF